VSFFTIDLADLVTETYSSVPQGAASLPATVTLTASARKVSLASAALPATVTLTANARRVSPVAAALPATVTLTASARRVSLASAALPVSVTLTATATAVSGGSTQQATAALPVSVSLTANARPVQMAAAALPVSVTLTAQARLVQRAAAALPVNVFLTGDPIRPAAEPSFGGGGTPTRSRQARRYKEWLEQEQEREEAARRAQKPFRRRTIPRALREVAAAPTPRPEPRYAIEAPFHRPTVQPAAPFSISTEDDDVDVMLLALFHDEA
jgi:hypothetical protein